ncbi:chorismate synthase [Methanosphaera sp. ISO3-F5]|uniref:chorismate synthase n=1 Tax=Methanosphaera sp. ISO3-F5 TaxID=1452353 RepID=UPI002B25D4A1|nr:chorismate synthase [Methanosphaera sp. ISO3-F5]WQH63358.1 chorismate synthase [Methanosphaera sp. ISO3-F5]
MASNTTGEIFKVTTFGASHGTALGATIDGCPAGIKISREDIQEELNKRRPGTSNITTARDEKDQVEILSGIFNGKTDGTPLTAIIRNKDQISKNYENLKNNPRPGHGDYCWQKKYENYDYRGGGRGSGRITIGHVIGGAVSKKILEQYDISTTAHVTAIHNIKTDKKFTLDEIKENITKNNVRCADLEKAAQMEERILEAKKDGNSVGGVVEIIIDNVPVGLGQPVFDKLDGDLAKALMNIGAVKAVEIGLGVQSSQLTGKEYNDQYILENDIIKTETNNSGGILGGMSNGMPIILKITVKPTPSVSGIQKTVNLEENKQSIIEIEGRHDPCICPRITTVAESACNMVLVDHMIRAGFIHPDKI